MDGADAHAAAEAVRLAAQDVAHARLQKARATRTADAVSVRSHLVRLRVGRGLEEAVEEVNGAVGAAGEAHAFEGERCAPVDGVIGVGGGGGEEGVGGGRRGGQ